MEENADSAFLLITQPNVPFFPHRGKSSNILVCQMVSQVSGLWEGVGYEFRSSNTAGISPLLREVFLRAFLDPNMVSGCCSDAEEERDVECREHPSPDYFSPLGGGGLQEIFFKEGIVFRQIFFCRGF